MGMITRYTKDADGIDELCATGADIHLERLNGRDWCLIIYCGDQRVHLNVRKVFEVETAGIASTSLDP
jgi:hypothetical protein